jgi:hypothetical protein
MLSQSPPSRGRYASWPGVCPVPPSAPLFCPQAFLLHRMGPPVSSAPPALWALGCFSLLLWLWALCTACHRYVHQAWDFVLGLALHSLEPGVITGRFMQGLCMYLHTGLGLAADGPYAYLCSLGLMTLLPPGSGLRGSRLGCMAV